MSTPRRAVLYLRLSTSDDASTSIARQETDLHARAEREGWRVVQVLIDDGISGRRFRENAEKALDLLSTGAADVLAVSKFDRWSRQGLGAVARLIETLDERPEALFVADRDGLTSAQPAWRIIAAVLAEVARMDAENTQARVRSSIAALKKARRFSGGIPPFGYRSAPNPEGPGRVLVVEPDEAKMVRENADRLLSGEPPRGDQPRPPPLASSASSGASRRRVHTPAVAERPWLPAPSTLPAPPARDAPRPTRLTSVPPRMRVGGASQGADDLGRGAA